MFSIFAKPSAAQDHPLRIPLAGSVGHPTGSGFVPVRPNLWWSDCPVTAPRRLLSKFWRLSSSPPESASSNFLMCRKIAIRITLDSLSVKDQLKVCYRNKIILEVISLARKGDSHKMTVIPQPTVQPAKSRPLKLLNQLVEAESLQWLPLSKVPSLLARPHSQKLRS